MHTTTWEIVEPCLHHLEHSEHGNFTVKMMEWLVCFLRSVQVQLAVTYLSLVCCLRSVHVQLAVTCVLSKVSSGSVGCHLSVTCVLSKVSSWSVGCHLSVTCVLSKVSSGSVGCHLSVTFPLLQLKCGSASSLPSSWRLCHCQCARRLLVSSCSSWITLEAICPS